MNLGANSYVSKPPTLARMGFRRETAERFLDRLRVPATRGGTMN